VPISYALGGTGPQAAWSLASIGAPALVALEDRSAHMLQQFHSDILIAENGKPLRTRDITPRGNRRPEIFIIEYTAGQAIGGVTPKRSSRIIVRFHDPGLEHDRQFEELSVALADRAGAGLISGFNSIPFERIDSEVAAVRWMTDRWRAAGLCTVHLELAGYDTPAHRDRVIARLQGTTTSLGMSLSEFAALVTGGSDLAQDMCDLGDRLGLDRVCVHADHWAASATRGDPETERRALMMGCLLAGTRAANGTPVYPREIDQRATFSPPPLPLRSKHGQWSIVSCAAPHLEHPVATVGLGDSFTGGCLLILGQRAAQHNDVHSQLVRAAMSS
jgi:ADP-dependent phosphofructokinase/glucokinase